MAKNLFSVPIFFIVFRETLEAAIIVSVLLGLAEQIVHEGPRDQLLENDTISRSEKSIAETSAASPVDDSLRKRRLMRKLRFQACFCNLEGGCALIIFPDIRWRNHRTLGRTRHWICVRGDLSIEISGSHMRI